MSTFPLTGACQCAQVEYQLMAQPEMIVACHCKACQKLSTSAFSITAIVKATDLIVTGKLKQWERMADSGNQNFAKFCPECGNRIYHFNPSDMSTLKLKPANISDTSWIKPSAHFWVSEKQEWFQIPDDVPQFQTQPK